MCAEQLISKGFRKWVGGKAGCLGKEKRMSGNSCRGDGYHQSMLYEAWHLQRIKFSRKEHRFRGAQEALDQREKRCK